MPTNAEIIAKLRDAIAAKLDGGAVMAYSINGRSLTNTSLTEIHALLRSFEAREAAESGEVVNYAEFDPVDGV